MAAQSTTGSFTGTIPENYDTHLGPILFEFTGADMAKRVSAALNGTGRVLEVACGTGISTRHLAGALAAGSEIQATDLNDAMLAHAARVNGGLPGVTYSQADALNLPFDDASFGAVVCQFGIMFFPDKAKGMAEFARVLRPGGLLALNVWDGFEHNPAPGVMDRVIKSHFETDPPRFLEVPFGSVTPEAGRSLIENAGFSDIEIATVRETVSVPYYTGIARGFVTGNPTILELQNRATVDPETVIQAGFVALKAEFGTPPTGLPFQETIFLARR